MKKEYSQILFTYNSKLEYKIFRNTNNVFHRTETNSSKFMWNHKRPRIAIVILRKKNTGEGITLPDITLPDIKLYQSAQHDAGIRTDT